MMMMMMKMMMMVMMVMMMMMRVLLFLLQVIMEDSVLWESGCILKVSWQYLYYWPRYRGYRVGGGKNFDDVDEDGEDNDDVDHEGQNEGETVLRESERILKVSCPYLQELLRYREYRGRGGKYFDDDDEDDDDGDDDDDDDVDDEGQNEG